MVMIQARSGSVRRLSGLNFFLADVRDGLGPFLGVFLMTQGWQADDIGYVMTAGGIAAMLATMPLGLLVDISRHKRLLLAGGIVLLLIGNLALWYDPSPAVTGASQIATGVVGALIGPAIMGLTLGLVGQAGLARQLGTNEAWNHAGNVAAAALAGLAGYRWGLPAVFVVMAAMGCGALICLRGIRPEDIDDAAARGRDPRPGPHGEAAPMTLRALAASPALRLLGVVMLLFHLGNAAMLPLLGQAAVARGDADPSAFTALTIIVAQLVMIPVALFAGRHAAGHGYGRLLLAAMLALPLRGLVAACWPSAWALIPVQVLDGIGAGLLGVALPGLVARILRGSGYVNAGLGAVMTLQGIGAAISPAFAGLIALHLGYEAAFLALGAVAVLGLGLCILLRRAIALADTPPVGGLTAAPAASMPAAR
jgi:MFS family permease